jgi:hypothetical protein
MVFVFYLYINTLYIIVLVLNKQEKKELVIKLANEGRTTRDIAQMAHVSLRDIGDIIRKASGDNEPSETDEQKKERELKNKTLYAQCFQMFRNGKPLIDIVIDLDLEAATVRRIYSDYLELKDMSELENIYADLKDDFPLFVHLYERIKKEGLTKLDITFILEIESQIKDNENRARLLNEHIEDLKTQELKLDIQLMEKE